MRISQLSTWLRLAPQQGARKSKRQHIKPLEWWRGERYVYGRNHDDNEPIFVVPIKEIIRIPDEAPQPLGYKRKRSSRGRSKKTVEQMPALQNPEEGLDANTHDRCVVLDHQGNTEERRECLSKMYQPKVENGGWKYQRTLTDGEFIAAGQLTIPIACHKPTKDVEDNTYV
ncbi:hypothetical protein M378DRAFT_92934, partial [Amanita muscaria Koide BX008]